MTSNPAVFGEYYHTFHNIFHFPEIAGIFVGIKKVPDIRINMSNCPVMLLLRLYKEVVNKGFQILRTIAQRRKPNYYSADTIEKILSHLSGGDFLVRVFIGC